MSRDEQARARELLADTYDLPHHKKSVLETPLEEMGPWFHHRITAIIEDLRGASGGGVKAKAGSGIAAIAAERQRQIEQEGWTPEHDDEHGNWEMAAAAAAYAFSAATYGRYLAADPLGFWPWDVSWWKPKGPREDLVRAGALIAAEIDRMDRAALARSGKADFQ